jgi:hypothetical protein
MSGLLIPSKHRNGERHLMRTIDTSCEKPHTRYTTNMRGPTFILVTHFIQKIKLKTFLNERGKISPLKLEGHFTQHVTAGVRMF